MQEGLTGRFVPSQLVSPGASPARHRPGAEAERPAGQGMSGGVKSPAWFFSLPLLDP